jgi:DNA-binding XRE family transcriptional regulator
MTSVIRTIEGVRTRDVVAISRIRALAASGEARAIRERAGVSQAEVAKAIGVVPSSVTHYENGCRVPRGDVALRYGRILDRLEAEVRS